ncbi:MAG: hypothetical protein K6B75_00430 [Lachnospiraceae bacterium]|nr:hypothetical protein [Lachnospiraceae bacterium]
MRKIGFVAGLILFLTLMLGGCSKAEFKDAESIKTTRNEIWDEYVVEESANETRKAEVKDRKMDFGEVTMKYGLQVVGDPDENGYPLYIALHGGGGGDASVNDSQWAAMVTYYKKYLKNGVYVNPRGVRDTWDCHGNPESYPLYDELIENMILYKNVDPNRVYVLGFSAGGDGVYLIAPKMADRFAAANMSAGHHNHTSVLSIRNMPIFLQVGEYDAAYDRNKVTVEYDLLLDEYARAYGGYEHTTYVHFEKGHNFIDNAPAEQVVIADNKAWLENGDRTTTTAKTYAISLLNEYTRDPLPEKVVWDLGNRANLRSVESFYWLSAPYTTNEGVLVASYSKENNSVTIESSTLNGDFAILINEDMLDVFSPITFNTPEGSCTLKLKDRLSSETIRETTKERGDKNYQFLVKVSYSELTEKIGK